MSKEEIINETISNFRNECSKLIIQSGIKEIVYMDDKDNGTDSDKAAKLMLDAAGVKYRKVSKISLNIE